MKSPPVAPPQLTRAIKDQWWDGDCPDALTALAQHPSLRNDKSAVVELAYEEFCLRRTAGEHIDADAFIARFPGYESSLRNVLLGDLMAAQLDSSTTLPDAPDAPAAPRPCWPALGEMIGDVTLLRELGRGAFARVYLATEASAGDRPVAIKLSPVRGDEAYTLGRLHHDHIVPVLWADRDAASGLHVVCMPYLGSATLIDVLDHAYRRGTRKAPVRGAAIAEAIERTVKPGDPLPDKRLAGTDFRRLSFVEGVAWLGEQLAEALAFLHGKQLTHCDLKPSNVLLTPEGQPLLLDFNLSQTAEVAPIHVGGTFTHMAPEQIEAWLSGRRLSAAEGARTDLYALGTILYELLTGRNPLGRVPSHLDGKDLFRWALEQQPRGFHPVRDLNPAVPAALADLVERCLALDPAARPSGTAVGAELRRLRQRAPLRLVLATAVLGLTALTVWAAGPVRAVAGKAEPAESVKAATRWQDFAARGHALMLRGNMPDARAYFVKARQTFGVENPKAAPPGWVLACTSFCYAGEGAHPQALLVGEQALDAGFRSAKLLNNLGYSAVKQKKFHLATRYLTEALRRDPTFLPAARNRAVLARERYLAALNAAKDDPEQRPEVPLYALKDCDRFIALVRNKPELEVASLYVDAARLYAFASLDAQRQLDGNPQDVGARQAVAFRQQRALDYLQRGCVLGADPGPLCNEPLFLRALDSHQIDAIKRNRLQAQKELPGTSTYLSDPLSASLR